MGTFVDEVAQTSDDATGSAHRGAQLRRFYPKARFNEWTLVPAGQRAQLVKPDPKRVGALQQGTELVVGADGSITGLLGASPGASTAVPIMLDLLRSTFPAQWHRGWKDVMSQAIPDIERTDWDAEAVGASSAATDVALGLGASGLGTSGLGTSHLGAPDLGASDLGASMRN
nr:malate:quinone oxidoreductase [Brevibacterium antiquum]